MSKKRISQSYFKSELRIKKIGKLDIGNDFFCFYKNSPKFLKLNKNNVELRTLNESNLDLETKIFEIVPHLQTKPIKLNDVRKDFPLILAVEVDKKISKLQ